MFQYDEEIQFCSMPLVLYSTDFQPAYWNRNRPAVGWLEEKGLKI